MSLPGNRLNLTTEPTVFSGSSGWYFSVTSSGASSSLSVTLDMANNTCQRSNGVTGTAIVEMYILGPPGTPFTIGYDWSQTVSAASNGRGTALGAGTTYSSFGYISAYAGSGQSDSKSSSGQGVATGTTSGRTTTLAGQTYSFAVSHALNAGAGTNGQCFACGSDGCFCDCGIAQATITLNAALP